MIQSERGYILKIQRVANGEVVFTLSGRMNRENVAQLEILFESESKHRPIVLDLRDLTLVDRDAVKFLDHCETDSIKLKNCPAYIREWIVRERNATRPALEAPFGG
jgi:ABC-type transporter Mla MlaB component